MQVKTSLQLRKLSLALTMVLCWPGDAAPKQHNKFPPFLTVDMFVAEYGGTPHPSVSGSGSSYVLHHAQGYLAGVADVSQSHTWCLPEGMGPAEAAEVVVMELAGTLPNQATGLHGALSPNAGRSLLARYAARFPINGRCTFQPYLTGDEFLRQLTGTHWTESKMNDQTIDKQRYAEGYLAGVIDSTQGGSWCAPRRLKPMEVESRVLTEMDKRKAVSSIRVNAASLLLELFNAKFPCPRL